MNTKKETIDEAAGAAGGHIKQPVRDPKRVSVNEAATKTERRIFAFSFVISGFVVTARRVREKALLRTCRTCPLKVVAESPGSSRAIRTRIAVMRDSSRMVKKSARLGDFQVVDASLVRVAERTSAVVRRAARRRWTRLKGLQDFTGGGGTAL
jgi:hypothetical protein